MSHLVANSPGLGGVQSPGGMLGYPSPATPAQQSTQPSQQPQAQEKSQPQNQAAASAGHLHSSAGLGGASHFSSSASRQAATPNAAARAAALAAEAALWKSEAEETVKTRKNALRVIVTKLRNFWPACDEAILWARASELEGGVYNTTGTKQEYIARLQKDLNSLGRRKDAELKTSKASLLMSGDIYAAMEKDEKGMQYPHGADARSKYAQKILVMDKKHHNMFSLLKQADDRQQKSGPENQMKEIVKSYQHLAALVDKGPYDLETLNRVDEKLDAYRHMAMVRSRQTGWGRESLEKQNDRTGQVAGRTLNKLRKLNQERPFIVADLGWSLEAEIPTISNPPEFALNPSKRRPASSLLEPENISGNRRPSKSPRMPWSAGHDVAVRPHVTSGMGGACVPSMRESHVKVSFAVPSTRAKGYVDFDVPNDADNQETSLGDSQATHLFTLEQVQEQLELALVSIPSSHALSLSSSSPLFPRSGVYREFVLSQKSPSRGEGAGGEEVFHTVTLTLVNKDPPEATLPWDTRVETLRKLPVVIAVSPKTHVTDQLLAAIMMMARSASASEWLQSTIDGICSHLSSVDQVWREMDALVSEFGEAALKIEVTDPPFEVDVASTSVLVDGGYVAGMPCPLGVCVTLSIKGCTGLPGLRMVSGIDYPRKTPVHSLIGFRRGLASARLFEKVFADSMEKSPSPLTITQVAGCWIEACRVSLTKKL